MTRGAAKLLAGWSASSLSEHDLAPSSAPSWLIGELLALLHAGGIRYGQLRPGHIVLMADASAAIARAVGSDFSQPVDPVAMAGDFRAPFESYEREDFRAIVSGYARAGYELIDAHSPGFTDTLLDQLGAPRERPRPAAPTFDVASVLSALGVAVRATAMGVALAPSEGGSTRNAWTDSPVDVVTILAACSMVELDYGGVLQGTAAQLATGKGAAFVELLKNQSHASEISEDALRALEREDGVSRAALAILLFGRSDPPNALAYALRVLQGHPESDVTPIADAVLALASKCALLAREAGCEPFKQSYYTQRATIALQHFTRGHRTDEVRSCQLAQTLHRCTVLPTSAAERDPWPRTSTEVALAQSVILVYRETFLRGAERCLSEGLGLPWSSAVRGLRYARRTLWCLHEGPTDVNEGTEEVAALMPSVIKSYAWLLGGMYEAAKAEVSARGESGWAAFFSDGEDGPAFLTQELTWIADFLELAANGPLSRDAVRYYMGLGERFAVRRGAQPAAGGSFN